MSSHEVSTVLRELAQNEVDTKGVKNEILFGEQSVLTLGNGRPIDTPDYKGLSVMLDRGHVVGSDGGARI